MFNRTAQMLQSTISNVNSFDPKFENKVGANARKKSRFAPKFKKPLPPVKPKVVHVPKKDWVENKRPMYKWAENEAAKKGYSGNLLNTLKMIITYTDLKGTTCITLETLHRKLIEKYGKGAPTKRTIDNHIAKLVEQKTISRSTQIKIKGLVKTRLLFRNFSQDANPYSPCGSKGEGAKLAKLCTQQLRTEYLLTKSSRDSREGDNPKIAAFPSTGSSVVDNFKKAQANAALSSPWPLGSAALNEQKTQDEYNSVRDQYEKQSTLKRLMSCIELKMPLSVLWKMGLLPTNQIMDDANDRKRI